MVTMQASVTLYSCDAAFQYGSMIDHPTLQTIQMSMSEQMWCGSTFHVCFLFFFFFLFFLFCFFFVVPAITATPLIIFVAFILDKYTIEQF